MQSGELLPALVAAGGGGAMLGGIVVHEYRQEAAMRAGRLTYAVTFPVGLGADAARAALGSLAGLSARTEFVVEVVATEDGIHHLLHLPPGSATSIIDHLAAALPGVRCDGVESRSTGPVTASLRIGVPLGALLRITEPEQASRALLTGINALRDGERVSWRWALRSGPAPQVPNVARPTSLSNTVEQRAWRTRLESPGFTAAGLLLVRSTSRQRSSELINHVIGVVRSRRGISAGLMYRRGRVRDGAVMPITGRCRGWLSVPELMPLLGWPIGSEVVPGVELGASRRLPVPRGVPREGRVLLDGRDAYGDRPVALSEEAARHHLAVVGPSGSGKSALLARAILDDLARGYGGVVIDPKADLARDVLDRVPSKHADRVVVLDPAAPGPVPGLDLLRTSAIRTSEAMSCWERWDRFSRTPGVSAPIPTCAWDCAPWPTCPIRS